MNEVLGMVEFSAGLGLMVGPVIGSGIYYFSGFVGVFVALAGLFVVFIPVIYYGLGPDRPYIKLEEAEEGVSLYMNPRLVVNSLAMGYSMALISFFDTTISPHLSSYGIPTVEIGLILAATDVGYTLASLILSRILKYLSIKWVLIVGILIGSVANSLMGPWEVLFPARLWVVIMGIACLSISIGVVVVASMPNLVKVATQVLGMANDDALADSLSSKSYTGMLATYMSLGEVVGPLMGGYLVDMWGFPNAAAVMGGMGVVLVGMLMVSERSRREVRQSLLANTES
jgi:predicted MFS family arabinose efflux permease